MNKISQNLILTAALVTVLNFQSCNKYDDGPTFALKTKKGRLAREWEVVKIYDNQGGLVFPGGEYSVEFEFVFEKDGDFEQNTSYSSGTYSNSYTYRGEWEFSSDKEELEIEINNSTYDWEIKRLTKEEFWFEDAYGNEWELEAK